MNTEARREQSEKLNRNLGEMTEGRRNRKLSEMAETVEISDLFLLKPVYRSQVIENMHEHAPQFSFQIGPKGKTRLKKGDKNLTLRCAYGGKKSFNAKKRSFNLRNSIYFYDAYVESLLPSDSNVLAYCGRVFPLEED